MSSVRPIEIMTCSWWERIRTSTSANVVRPVPSGALDKARPPAKPEADSVSECSLSKCVRVYSIFFNNFLRRQV